MERITYFASPEVDEPAVVQSQAEAVGAQLEKALENLPDMTAVINDHRQIVYANHALRSLAPATRLLGLRPGDALECRTAGSAPSGCGTNVNCRFCGAVGAILEAQTRREPIQAECSIQTDQAGQPMSIDLRVSVVPFEIGGRWYQILTLSDIAGEKKREALERVFFHDVLNTASGIHATVSLLNDSEDQQERDELLSVLGTMADGLVEEIRGQRLLLSAENGTLPVEREQIRSVPFLERIARRFSQYEIMDGKTVEIRECGDVLFESDPTILARVLVNLVKNALEASRAGDSVHLSCRRRENEVVFSVWNPDVMSHDVQLQIFDRRFSTTGKDRGLGTHSVKLFVETYLGGRVTFRSEEPGGTTFFVALPVARDDT